MPGCCHSIVTGLWTADQRQDWGAGVRRVISQTAQEVADKEAENEEEATDRVEAEQNSLAWQEECQKEFESGWELGQLL